MMKFFLITLFTLVVTTASVVAKNPNLGLRRTQVSACSPGCTRSQFCGSDGQCRDYNCNNWFKFGTWTNLEDISSTTRGLTCADYTNGVEDNYHAVIYSCGGFGPGTEITDGAGFSQVFNQRCFSDIGLQTFECYQMELNTDYSFFLSEVESSDLPDCEYSEEQIADGSPASPSFLYRVTLEEAIFTEHGGTTSNVTLTGPNPTDTFDTDLALVTMYAFVKEKKPTLSPTDSPTPVQPDVTSSPTPTPAPEAGGGGSSSSATSYMVAVVATWVLAVILN